MPEFQDEKRSTWRQWQRVLAVTRRNWALAGEAAGHPAGALQ